MIKALPTTICMAPFTGMRQNAYGQMSPCPFGAGEWNLEGLSTKEKFFSPQWSSLCEKFLKGYRPSECSRCWNEEDAGKKSMRQIYQVVTLL